jgi:poly-gamma-glutamate capsule biosynthesis protein CapA/YwtB (metallophosphatase superfamily)
LDTSINSIIILGDIAFTGILSTEPEKNRERFKEVVSVLAESDLVFANLEVPVKIDESRNEYKNFIYYSLPEATEQLLKLLNIGCVSLANNHIYDCKLPGLKTTIKVLDKQGIYHTGAGWKKEHIEPVIIKKDDVKVGFLAYVDKSTNPKTETFPELFINYFEIEKVIEDVQTLKPKVDEIICSIHWGVDYSHYPTEQQRVIARRLIDAGVNIIMGHHPHTLQPHENYKEGHIFYSLGNFTFGDYIKEGKSELQGTYKKTKNGLIVKYNGKSNTFCFVSTKEKKGNFVVLSNRDYLSWSEKKWRIYFLTCKFKIIRKMVILKEKVFDIIIEYFFGYYKNPIKQMFKFSNIKKIGRLFK